MSQRHPQLQQRRLNARERALAEAYAHYESVYRGIDYASATAVQKRRITLAQRRLYRCAAALEQQLADQGTPIGNGDCTGQSILSAMNAQPEHRLRKHAEAAA